MTQQQPPAGWYPDPSGSGQQRYFDGISWGPVAPTAAPYAPPTQQRTQPSRFTIHYGFALLAFFSLLGTVIPAFFWFAGAANAHSDPGAT